MLQRRKRRGFTLVELLVVIGIIALLISVLLPALNKAREQSNKVACMSNLRQLASAMLMYTDENKGFFPHCAAGTRNVDGHREDWIYCTANPLYLNKDEGRLVKYLGRKFVTKHYRCPSDADLETRAYPYSYSVNYFITGYVGQPATNPRIRVSKVRQSSTKILFVDESSGTVDDGAWAPDHFKDLKDNVLSNRHDKRSESKDDPNFGRGNVVFADFHVEFIERKHSFDERYYLPQK